MVETRLSQSGEEREREEREREERERERERERHLRAVLLTYVKWQPAE